MKKSNVSLMVVMVVVLMGLFSSCTDEYEMPVFDRIDMVDAIEYNTTYSVEGLTEISIYLSANEQYDMVSFRTGKNAFNEKDCVYLFIQSDTITVKIPNNTKYCRFELLNGTSPRVHVEKNY